MEIVVVLSRNSQAYGGNKSVMFNCFLGMSSGGGSGGDGDTLPTAENGVTFDDAERRQPTSRPTGSVHHTNARARGTRHSPPACRGYSPPPGRTGGRGWNEPTPNPTSTSRGRRPRGGAPTAPRGCGILRHRLRPSEIGANKSWHLLGSVGLENFPARKRKKRKKMFCST